jgi:hypothetical protein
VQLFFCNSVFFLLNFSHIAGARLPSIESRRSDNWLVIVYIYGRENYANLINSYVKVSMKLMRKAYVTGLGTREGSEKCRLGTSLISLACEAYTRYIQLDYHRF